MATATPNSGFSLEQLRDDLGNTAFAFRGYNVTNLERTPELLAIPAYEGTLLRRLDEASEICGEIKGRKVDLAARVRRQEETDLDSYDEAIAMIVAVEMAQLDLFAEFHDIDFRAARTMYGFSLGEIGALAAAGVFSMRDAIRIPLAMSDAAVRLAEDVCLGVLFSRRGVVSRVAVDELCQEINFEGRGVIGVSAYLAPNSMLLIGQGDTLNRFKARMKPLSPHRLYVRRNEHKWPPLHTPIVWQEQIRERAQTLLHTLPVGHDPPHPPIFSMVTGAASYTHQTTRQTLGDWIDHPQKLWEAVDYTLSQGIETVVHVGPQPNIIPATFSRLSVNVEAQTKGSVRMRALSGMINRPWLQALLPRRATLLRAPRIRHVVLEDWLIENAPTGAK